MGRGGPANLVGVVMDADRVALGVLKAAKRCRWAARFVPMERRFDLWRELENHRQREELDETFLEERLRIFQSAMCETPGWAGSILVVAMPDPAFRIRFEWHDREVALTVPPTFIHANTRGESQAIDLLAGHGVRAETAVLPKKLLAARCGLTKYGRNGITYREGLGSYHRICCLYTEIPCDQGVWKTPEALDSCASCGACVQACPAGAIESEGFRVRAERCLTYWQEKPAGIPYPEELDFSWQEQFIGCLRCQAACPQNRGRLTTEEAGPPFSAEETARLLRGAGAEELPEETVGKLKQHDILEYLDVLPRNLEASLRNAHRFRAQGNA